MLIEKLEERRLLSSSTLVYQGILNLLDHGITRHTRMKTESEGAAVAETGLLYMIAFPATTPKLLHPAAATAATPEYLSLTFATPAGFGIGQFNPASLEPFGATYTAKLNPKKPLNLFNITQTIGKEKLHFTGVTNAKLTKLTGVLKVTGPTNQVSFTYTSTS